MAAWYDVEGIGSPDALVSIDWLAFSCRVPNGHCPDPVLPDGWEIRSLNKTPAWGVREYVLLPDGTKVATILRKPTLKQIAADRALVEMANWTLYSSILDEWVTSVLDIYRLEVTGLNRLDLACDFDLSSEGWSIVSSLGRNACYVQRYQQGSAFWQLIDGQKVPHCQSWGSHDSSMKWKCYYKWLELTSDGQGVSKPYIVNCWDAIGLHKEIVWRVEVSLTKCNKLELPDGRKLSFPFVWYQRAAIWQSLYSNNFVQRKTENHQNRRLDERVSLVGDIDRMKLLSYGRPSGHGHMSDAEQRVARKLWQEYVNEDVKGTPVEKLVASTLCDMVVNPAVLSYLSMLSGMSGDKITHGLSKSSMGHKAALSANYNIGATMVEDAYRNEERWVYPSELNYCPVMSYFDRHGLRLGDG